MNVVYGDIISRMIEGPSMSLVKSKLNFISITVIFTQFSLRTLLRGSSIFTKLACHYRKDSLKDQEVLREVTLGKFHEKQLG